MNLEDTKSWSWEAAVKKLSRSYQRHMRKSKLTMTEVSSKEARGEVRDRGDRPQRKGSYSLMPLHETLSVPPYQASLSPFQVAPLSKALTTLPLASLGPLSTPLTRSPQAPP